jgi:energy-coupling factor transporter ATP-binding protein EcfA2
MRIEEIALSWFRGAGSEAVLRTANKSVVVYGANGSGKSAFADAVEYVVGERRIGHLVHEYSGRRQELGIRNTHAPSEQPTIVGIRFGNGARVEVKIEPDGASSATCDSETTESVVRSWEVARLILRQDELSVFIHKTKGGKYSALLPLLGLERLEQAAENLHRIEECVRQRGRLREAERQLDGRRATVSQAFPEWDRETVDQHLDEMGTRYVDSELPEDFSEKVDAIGKAIDRRIQSSEPDSKLHFCLKGIDSEGLPDKLSKAKTALQEAENVVDALLDRRIAVLEAASRFAESVPGDEEEVLCPACGRTIKADDFRRHLQDELSALKEARAARETALNEQKNFVDSLQGVLRQSRQAEAVQWLNTPAQEECREALVSLEAWNASQRGWSAEQMQTLAGCVAVICSHVERATKTAPPSTSGLFEDKKAVEAAACVEEICGLEQKCAEISAIAEALTSCEDAIRDAIKARTEAVVEGISDEVQHLWSRLHPEEPIENVHLYIPGDADKSIDVGLRFYGKDQPSPRLTLSEGHRNSLGLCIFLALAKLDTAGAQAIILDDVVSSFDREHRGMLVDILLEDFPDRQVLLFTHDREWFSELRWRLPSARWNFMRLRRWENPQLGLQWSGAAGILGDARELVAVNPEAAGNRVRAIMDAELALASEKLMVPMPFARGDRNDRRTCIEFLECLISEAPRRLRKREEQAWLEFTEPIEEWREARSLLGAWANRASHTGTLVAPEVNRLIEQCEKALAYLRCSSCGDPIWISDQANRERVQCSCDCIQWRYG